jgi:hypothetical protein
MTLASPIDGGLLFCLAGTRLASTRQAPGKRLIGVESVGVFLGLGAVFNPPNHVNVPLAYVQIRTAPDLAILDTHVAA